MIAELRNAFNAKFDGEGYRSLLDLLEFRCGTRVEFRVAETPVFLPRALLHQMADLGAAMTRRLIRSTDYRQAAKRSIPQEFLVAGDSAHPNFLTADFALVDAPDGEGLTETVASYAGRALEPRLVELQAFPSVYAYQAMLTQSYREVFGLPKSLGTYLDNMDDEAFWAMLKRTILGKHEPENVVLTEVDPFHQKTLPDFLLTRDRLGIAIVDVATLIPIGNKLHYRNEAGKLVPIHRIYNRAIADEIIARRIQLPFRWTEEWDVEWAGHPNWYFLISKFSVPWLARMRSDEQDGSAGVGKYVPPAVFLKEFLDGDGRAVLKEAGVWLPNEDDQNPIYEDLLLKPLFSFAGKGIEFAPSRESLLAIPEQERSNFLLQQRMDFVPTIETPHGLTQAEVRILYLWPDGGKLTPVISLVRLGRGKMMGVDHNKNQEWVGGSAAFWR